MSDSTGGCLFLVPTPIGNLEDITERAIKTLEAADLVACEDTRHSGQLLKLLGLKKRLVSYHDFNESYRAGQLSSLMTEGKTIAVITDAGSPGISDPAYRLVRSAIDAGIPIVPLPGPTALIPAVTASGLPTDRFFFEGFLSNKSAARRNRLEKLKDFDHTLVFYESPHRTHKALHDMLEILGDRPACLAREISKKFEEFIRGKLSELITRLEGKTIKGEVVLVIAGAGFAGDGKDEKDE
ncbi:MAG TPA: 16S rRNA (cytidine(1402)-2'-O)-methyltransferase [candidate division Zixibacteria bacterium]|nr:16S rRNA (cytidine(1402)-2'-O)-methyltransferase [candidate division Zixibacteria bacterium]